MTLSASYRGRVWQFGDDIDTDRLAPYRSLRTPWPERRATVLRERPEFANDCQPGDILVGGRNFGCGSSRELAVDNLRELGISCLLAESFARIFYRNAIATGFPTLSVPGIATMCRDGDYIEVSLREGRLRNRTRSTDLRTAPLEETMLAILDAGGLLPLLKLRAHPQHHRVTLEISRTEPDYGASR
jgi:3-isopropylmalate/(R)-2-methylmalate dehydratase small subunit